MQNQFLQTVRGECKIACMRNTELSEKIRAIADSAGLSPEEVQEFLSGGEAIPDDLREVFERIGDAISEECAED
ncbi:hypothetical protein Desal_0272 [Maridesulfovibrio salexigens DSM 2638]|uniref:Uncharacterized protein n=2 Tax=Maridesulfovibrio salexigens TaxID=880 RepID=C6BW95_MARSD|nr:hypothetical protein Desal_0272 [Maridesulfovibrio salexigens DSM 2638]